MPTLTDRRKKNTERITLHKNNPAGHYRLFLARPLCATKKTITNYFIMADWLKPFLDILSSKSNSSMYKVTLFLILFIVAVSVDFSLGLSRNYHMGNKLNQIEKVNQLKSKYSSDPEKMEMLNLVEDEIFDSKHYLSYLHFKFSKEEGNIERKVEDNKEEIPTEYTRSLILMFLSSGSIFFILMMVRLTTGKGGHGTAIDSGYLLSLSISLTLVMYFIPVIIVPNYNYIINFVIQLIVLLFVMIRMSRQN